MWSSLVPVKTPTGQEELSKRTLRLSQRHRTVLLLVDGRRSVEELLLVAAQAGAPRELFDELLQLGLIALPQGQAARAAVVAAQAVVLKGDQGSTDHVDLPLSMASPPVAAPAASVPAQVPEVPAAPTSAAEQTQTSAFDSRLYDSLLPAARSLLPESEQPASTQDHSGPGVGLERHPFSAESPLEEARELLIRSVRNEAPVSGSITIMKLRRAANAEELEALLEEVEQRIRKPRKVIIAAQMLRHVRHLLSLSAQVSAGQSGGRAA